MSGSAHRQLEDALSDVATGKIKQRTAALKTVRDFFDKPRSVDSISRKSHDAKITWQQIYTSLFKAVLDEKSGWEKKKSGSASASAATLNAARDRLKECASLLRLLVEKSVTLVNRKTLKHLISHLVHTLVSRTELCHPIALEYLKSLHTIFSYQPHLDHLEVKTWTNAVAFLFSALLGDALHADEDFEFTEFDEEANKPTSLGHDSDMDSSQMTGDSGNSARTASLQSIEITRCLEMLFRSRSSPILEHPESLLAKLSRFFQAYPSETSAHLPIFTVLNSILVELEFNARTAMVGAAAKLWPQLLGFWHSKQPLVREQVIISLHILAPFVSPPLQQPQLAAELLRKLFELFVSDTDTRWKIDELDMDTLALGYSSTHGQEAFSGRTFRKGQSFTSQQAISWLALECMADCLISLQRISVDTLASQMETQTDRKKRRKLEEPVRSLLDMLSSTSSSDLLLHRLQLAVFYLERHGPDNVRDRSILSDMFGKLLNLLSHEDVRIRSWSFLGIANIAAHHTTSSDSVLAWDRAWDQTIRRINHSDTARAACLATQVMIDFHCVNQTKILTDIASIIRDIDISGPPVPTDAACLFLSRSLRLATADARLSQLQFNDKVGSWLLNNWNPYNFANRNILAKGRQEPMGVQELFGLLIEICHLPPRFSIFSQQALPDCAAVNYVLERQSMSSVREWYFKARLPQETTAQPADIKQESVSRAIADHQVAKLTAMFRKTLEDAREEAAVFVTYHPEKVRRLFDVVVLAAALEGALRCQGRPTDKSLHRHIFSNCENLAVWLRSSRWSLADRALILTGLSPLLLPFLPPSRPLDKLIAKAGTSSGAERQLLRQYGQELERPKVEACVELLQRVWSSDFRDALTPLFEAVERFLLGKESDVNGAAMDIDKKEDSDDDDDFGRIRTVSAVEAVNDTLSNVTFINSADTCISIAFRMLLSGPILRTNNLQPAHLPEIAESIGNGDGANTLRIGFVLSRAIRSNLLALSEAENVAILDHIGTELMPSYEYSRDERVNLFIVDFLEATAPQWVLRLQTTSSNKSRSLSRFFLKQHSDQAIGPWRIRLAFANFAQISCFYNPSQDMWDPIEGEDAEEEDATIIPLHVLIGLLNDQDLRVRTMAAKAMAAVIPIIASRDVPEIYQDMRHSAMHESTNLVAIATQSEKIIPLILFFVNLVVASRITRIACYDELLRFSSFTPDYHAHIIAALSLASRYLGFTTLSHLYTFYTPLLTEARLADGYLGTLPAQVCGFRNQAQLVQTTFTHDGPIFLRHNVANTFEALCNRQLQVTPIEGRQRCLPATLARILLQGAKTTPHDLAPVEYVMNDEIKVAGLEVEAAHKCKDEIAVRVLTSFYERKPSKKTLLPLYNQGSPEISTLDQLLEEGSVLDLEKNPPIWSASPGEILIALKWYDRQASIRQPSTTLSVVQHILYLVHSSPIISECQRLLFALCLFLSFANKAARTLPVLRTTMHFTSILANRPQLSTFCRRILFWAIRVHSEITTQINCIDTFGSILVRAVDSFSKHINDIDEIIRAAAVEAHEKLSQLVKEACVADDGNGIRTQGRFAALMWPEPLADIDLPLDIAFELVEKIASRAEFTSNKFRLVRSLSAYSNSKGIDNRLGKALWTILSVSNTQGIDKATSILFADLLFQNSGVIENPPLHASRGSLSEPKETLASAENAIQLRILTLIASYLTDQNLSLQNTAAHTLKVCYGVSTAPEPVVDAGRRTRKSSGVNTLSFTPDAVGEILLLRDPSLNRQFGIRRAQQRSLDELESQAIWQDKYLRSHTEWLGQIIKLLTDIRAQDHQFYAPLQALALQHEPFASALLPILVHSLLNSTEIAKTPLSAYFLALFNNPKTPLNTIKLLVDTVVSLRNFKQPGNPDPVSENRWLQLPWLDVARAAIRSGKYPAALMFLELANEQGGLTGDAITPDLPTQSTLSHMENSVRQMLYTIYVHLDDPDGFYGVPFDDVTHFLSQRYQHENSWNKALDLSAACYEANALSSSPHAPGSLIETLMAVGYPRMAASIQTSAVGRSGENVQNLELAWRTELWDIPISEASTASKDGSLFKAMRAIYRERNSTIKLHTVETSIHRETLKLANVQKDQVRHNTDAIAALLCLREIQSWVEEVDGSKQINQLPQATLDRTKRLDGSFSDVDSERILSVRTLMLNHLRSQEKRNSITDIASQLYSETTLIQQQILLELSHKSQAHGDSQRALNAVMKAKQLSVDLENGVDAVEEALAEVLWGKGEHSVAIKALKEVNRRDGNTLDRSNASRLAKLGTWISTARQQPAEEVLAGYFQPAFNLITQAIKTDKSVEGASQVFASFASFADGQYQALMQRSDAMEQMRIASSRMESDISQQIKQSRTLGTQSDIVNARKHARDDLESYNRYIQSRKQFLKSAIDAYLSSLKYDDSPAENLFRFCSIWMANASDGELNLHMKRSLSGLPSHKILGLIHQLSARLAKPSPPSTEQFQENLFTLLSRACTDHPFHTLYSVFCLKSPANPTETPPPSGSKSRGRASLGTPSQVQTTSRQRAAEELWSVVHKKLPDRVGQLDTLCQTYIAWAFLELDSSYKSKDKAYAVPKDMKIYSMRDMAIPITTCALQIDYTKEYSSRTSSAPFIRKYSEQFATAGGIHLPKIHDCVGTDGRRYKQLFKSKDDVRQDSVMEQIFGLTNDLLALSPATKRRKLRVRTYKVIPLTGESGLLEFVTNTQALSQWLIPSHMKYHPEDWKHVKCTLHLKEQLNSTTEARITAYEEVMKHVHPVMRHYFFEKQKDPSNWFEMRLNYSRSVAASSMVGFVLGLGDRHISNILIDSVLGEVIPIDLGIAFDGGKLLRTPELVPFRLTPDMINGLGMSGVDGVFRQCSEETLKVLRQGQKIIMTILEVFKYDPLQKWTMTATKLQRAHTENDLSKDKEHVLDDAQRAIRSVTTKLSSELSVEYQVNQLIQEATSIQNLALIYFGWSPFY